MSLQLKDSHKEWPMNKIRSSFIKFFEENGHTFWGSSPCVPVDDPTLLFINAGMNQFKPLFLGTIDPNNPMSNLKRACNSQKCIRAGGKHNDLEDVGKDVYHHTFFEMLGNWSFGDYFKAEAIDFAWKCLTEVFKLDQDRLYATYFEGNEDAPADLEAKELWLKYLPEERVIPFGAKDNFWEMGATGPCGPCTEIHYDRIGGRCAPELVNADLPEMIEIWNNVFIQFNRESDGSLKILPDQHVDTGMGFERLTSILQGVDSNYDTDVFIPIFNAIEKATGAKPYSGKVGADDVGFVDMAYRVIADHIRTLCFAIADGAVPSNADRGYVLRRILRRAVRYGRQNLGAELGFFSGLVDIVVDHMGGTFPELKHRKEFITAVIMDEETSFSRTLDKGLAKFNEMASECEDKGTKNFSAADAHFLYTSMGFPIDLTNLMAEERGMHVDESEFEALMEAEKELSREAQKKKMAEGAGGKDLSVTAEQTSALQNMGVEATVDEFKFKWEATCATVKAIYHSRSVGFVDSITAEDNMVGVVFDQTNYYAEAGGQVFDTGVIEYANGTGVFKVENVQVYGGFVVHLGCVVGDASALSVGSISTLKPDFERRSPIAKNHTSTHILNYALRKVLVLGDVDVGEIKSDESGISSLEQKGSYVDESKLRFDFSHNAPLTLEELTAVENICNEVIAAKKEVFTKVTPLAEALKINSLRAVFGEVYPDPVRVVSVGLSLEDAVSQPTAHTNYDYSIEFCGGTHLSNTSEAQYFILLSEEGIAKGIRRIVGLTGDLANEAKAAGDELTQQVNAAGELNGLLLEEAVKSLLNEVNSAVISSTVKLQLRETLQSYSKRVVEYKKQQEKDLINTVIESIDTSDDSKKIIVHNYNFGASGKVAKAVTTAFAKRNKDKALLLVTADGTNKRVMVIAVAPKGKDSPVDCSKWVKSATEGLNGRGGGKKDSAQTTIEYGDDDNEEAIVNQILEKAKL